MFCKLAMLLLIIVTLMTITTVGFADSPKIVKIEDIEVKPFGVTKYFTPTLKLYDKAVLKDNPDFRRIWWKTLLLDAFSTIDQIGTVLPQDVPFRSLYAKKLTYEDGEKLIVVVITCGEFYKGPAWVDSRFLEFCDEKPVQRVRQLPTRQEILDGLEAIVGLPYIWGGAAPAGIPELLEFYGIPADEPKLISLIRALTGVDCSGALWYVSNYITPRTTTDLAWFGRRVDIEGKTPEEIVKVLKPLDLIVWYGHLLIVMRDGMVFESIHGFYVGDRFGDNLFAGGSRIVPLLKRLQEICNGYNLANGNQWTGKTPVNDFHKLGGDDCFVVRRWYPE